MRFRALLAVGVALTIAAGSPGCGGDDETAGSPSTAPFPVGRTTLELADDGRAAVAPDGNTLAEGRALPTVVRYPEAEGPFPLVVFAHGLAGTPESFDELLDGWAAAGFVVAAPIFPLTNREIAPGLGEDVVAEVDDQALDLSVVIDGVLGAAADPASPLAGRVDDERIGAAGMSLGGGTVYALIGSACCRDDRVDAVVVLSGKQWPLEASTERADSPPVLVLHGDADDVIPVTEGQAAYSELDGPRWFVRLAGADHASPYQDEPSPWDPTVATLTAAFWEGAFGGADPSEITAQLEEALGPDTAAVLERGP